MYFDILTDVIFTVWISGDAVTATEAHHESYVTDEIRLEPEDFQSVGMQLRECLISLIAGMRRAANITSDVEHTQHSNFVAWSSVLMDMLCPGSSDKELRQYLKNAAKDTWQLVNWLTHDRNASEVSSLIAIHACDTVVGHFIQVLHRSKTEKIKECPLCKSRDIRSHYDPTIQPSGDYFLTCGKCEWTNHPEESLSDRPDR